MKTKRFLAKSEMEIKPVPSNGSVNLNKSLQANGERYYTLSFEMLSMGEGSAKPKPSSTNLKPTTKQGKESKPKNTTKIIKIKQTNKTMPRQNTSKRPTKRINIMPSESSSIAPQDYSNIQPKRTGNSRIRKNTQTEITQTSEQILAHEDEGQTNLLQDIAVGNDSILRSSDFYTKNSMLNGSSGAFLTESDLTTDSYIPRRKYSFQQEDDIEYNTVDDTTYTLSANVNTDETNDFENNEFSNIDYDLSSTKRRNYLTDESEISRDELIFNQSKMIFLTDEGDLAPGQLSPPAKSVSEIANDKNELTPENLGIWLRFDKYK